VSGEKMVSIKNTEDANQENEDQKNDVGRFGEKDDGNTTSC